MLLLTRFSRCLLLAAPLSLGLGACNFLDVGPPPTQVVDANVYTSSASATAAVLGIYINLNGAPVPGITQGSALSANLGVAADELLFANGSLDEFRLNQLNPAGPYTLNLWNQAYASLYQCNAAVAGLTGNASLPTALQSQLLGETKFIRAFLYFYLTSLYGDVPLVLTTNYTVSGVLPRTPQAQVYAQIVLDLTEAQAQLPDAYPVAGERTRANRAAATALLARVNLYQQNWAGAETQATAVISQSGVYTLPALADVFLTGSPEAIWQLRTAGTVSTNTYDGLNFIPASLTTAPTDTYLLSPSLLSALSGDPRLTAWTSTYNVAGTSYTYPYKYKQRVETANAGAATEFNNTLRLAEQYLIRAEARIKQGKTATGLADVNVVRARAGAPLLATTLSQADALLAVETERRLELFTEYGHRWFDLIRTGRVAAVLAPYKGTAWNANHNVWPLPTTQLLANRNLVQNTGY